MEAREYFDALLIDAVVKKVGEASEDRSSVARGDFRKGFGEFSDQADRILKGLDELGPKAESSVVVPLPSQDNVGRRLQSEADLHVTASLSGVLEAPPTKRSEALARKAASRAP